MLFVLFCVMLKIMLFLFGCLVCKFIDKFEYKFVYLL